MRHVSGAPARNGALLDSDTCDMDVDALLQGFLRGVRQAGGRIVTQAEVKQMQCEKDGLWHVQAGGRTFVAPVVVNAPGPMPLPAWPEPNRSGWSHGAVRRSLSQRLKAWI